MEERVLIPATRRALGGDALLVARRLRLAHGAIAALLVPTPTHA
jgi:NAD(P)H-hydrate repair Nnr-like enzyme with NAD(P)H-hydrate epimerase domain